MKCPSPLHPPRTQSPTNAPQAKTLAARIQNAVVFADAANIPKARVLVDGMDNAAELAFEARPEKLVLVQDGMCLACDRVGVYG
jgi:hypothetical protein